MQEAQDCSQVGADIHYLAGMLLDRTSNSENEKLAADYLLERFKQFTPHVDLDPFESSDSFYRVFASYYGEFIFVGIVATWLPWPALIYGVTVFVAYMAEFTGYRLLGRLLPQYQSQNVNVRFLSDRPRQTIIVTAHYDSGKATPLTSMLPRRWLRWIHLIVVVCMVLVLLTCASHGLGTFADSEIAYDVRLRWMAVVALGVAAGFMMISEAAGETVRGAVANASGVGVLLELARRIKAAPLREADVWLVATGSKEGWMNGMRRLMNGRGFDKETTTVINIDHIGQGQLCYVTAEGLLHLFKSPTPLVSRVAAVAPKYDASPIIVRDLPTDALIPLARGIRAVTITTSGKEGPFHLQNRLEDKMDKINMPAIDRTSAFVEDVLRYLEQHPVL